MNITVVTETQYVTNAAGTTRANVVFVVNIQGIGAEVPTKEKCASVGIDSDKKL